MSEAPIDIGHVELSDQQQPEQPPRPRSRVRLILLSTIAAAALAGTAAIGWTAWRIASQKDATLTTPGQIGALRLDEGEDARSLSEYMQNALSADVDVDRTVGAVYTDAAGQNVLFFGGTTLFWTPEADLDTAFKLISDKEGAVRDIRAVPAGALGGTMKCGVTDSDGGDMPVCGWADHGSLALAMFPGRQVSEAAPLLVEIRDATQKR